jgi:hypothetical protein
MRARFLNIVAVIGATAALGACSETSGEDTYGTIEAAITAPGGNGSTYRLPDGTVASVFSATYGDSFSLDGDAQVVAFDVPVGDYDVYLQNYNGYTVEWPLQRTNADMTVETVNATLLTPTPVAVTVLEDQVSNLVFQFQVVDGGTITFAQGTIQISVAVDETESVAGRLDIGGDYQKNYENFGETAPAALADRVPAVGDAIFQDVYLNVVGDWVQSSSNTVCSSASFIGGVVSGNIYDLTLEAWTDDATARVCLYGNGASPYIYIDSFRSGPPLSSTFLDLGTDFYIQQFVGDWLPNPVFDGETLDLSGLTGTLTLPNAGLSTVVWALNGDGNYDYWYQDSYGATSVTLRFRPQI